VAAGQGQVSDAPYLPYNTGISARSGVEVAVVEGDIRSHLTTGPKSKAYLRRVANERETSVKQALRQLLSDFLSAILFLVVYVVSGSLFAAAGIAVAAGLGQLIWLRLTHRRIEPMQWMSLGLVVVLGSATMLTQSPRFMMIKPTIVHFAVATVMLRRGWMLRYLPEIVLGNVPEPTIVAAGYGWAALLAVLGLANLFIALRFDFATWAWFVSVGAGGAKLAAVALQYGVFRAIVRQRLAQSGM
jgi:intracellular septation protein